jgi:hypothetical protein
MENEGQEKVRGNFVTGKKWEDVLLIVKAHARRKGWIFLLRSMNYELYEKMTITTMIQNSNHALLLSIPFHGLIT